MKMTTERVRRSGRVARQPERPQLPPMYSIAETAEALGVSTNTVDRLLSEGILPRVKIGRRLTRIPLAAIEAYLLAQGVQPADSGR